MSPVANLNTEREVIGNGNDSIVIRKYGAGVKGGATLNMEGFPHNVIRAGHVVIHDDVNNEYKPMPLNAAGTAYAALPANHRYAGVCVQSALKKTPMVGIMYAGEVNDVVSPYPVDGIMAAMKEELPTLVFMHD